MPLETENWGDQAVDGMDRREFLGRGSAAAVIYTLLSGVHAGHLHAQENTNPVLKEHKEGVAKRIRDLWREQLSLLYDRHTELHECMNIQAASIFDYFERVSCTQKIMEMHQMGAAFEQLTRASTEKREGSRRFPKRKDHNPVQEKENHDCFTVAFNYYEDTRVKAEQNHHTMLMTRPDGTVLAPYKEAQHTADQYMSHLAEQLQTPEDFDAFFRYAIRYEWDNGDVWHNYDQFLAHIPTPHRQKQFLYGDCEDQARFFQKLLEIQGKKSLILVVRFLRSAHALTAWIEREKEGYIAYTMDADQGLNANDKRYGTVSLEEQTLKPCATPLDALMTVLRHQTLIKPPERCAYIDFDAFLRTNKISIPYEELPTLCLDEIAECLSNK